MNLLNVIAHNFWLKIISLVLAIATWFYVFDLVNPVSFTQRQEKPEDVFARYQFTIKEVPVKLVFTGKTPEGYRVAYTGQNKEQKEAEEFLTEAFMGAVFLISFILILQFNSIVTPTIIMSSVILSMIGVLVGLMATGTPFLSTFPS